MASSQGSLDADMADPIYTSTSDYEEENELSQFTSLTSTRQFFKFEQGRRYQALLHDRYGLPNDDIEHMREGIKHQFHIDYILNGNLHTSPLGNPPQKIVDLGTGAGFWALDDKFGWKLDTSRNIPQLLKDAGFVNIQLRQREVPFGRWPNDKRLREMGMFNQVIAQDMAVTLLNRHAMLSISEEEATALGQDLSDAANDPAIHAFLGGVSVWAQKPG
ncbi:uncharacterized protein J7T54_002353 [Emericellopsis cladophorae]|uniref:Methyltransferase domain-containing protein n=1 Tax=Emericellopsis cladophorae TaxID=2686198 RepID=A0A9P9Y2G5_9HYPO|nr:uncharacterized protein J7T54_002353 [Emericellopsis cladophorae]KAI6782116.1 hypothetical protein J7T54_002353 [Emericellopsis cladophorae]